VADIGVSVPVNECAHPMSFVGLGWSVYVYGTSLMSPASEAVHVAACSRH
jgi:hypothetical protein